MPPKRRASTRLQDGARKRALMERAAPRRSRRPPGANPKPRNDSAAISTRKETSLADLPDELLLLVFQHFRLARFLYGPLEEQVSGYEGRLVLFQKRCDALRSISQTCRNLCRVAQPLLYEVVNCLNHTNRRMDLLRTLICRKDLAGAVREVHLRHEFDPPRRGLAQRYPELIEAARHVDIEMGRSFIGALRTGRCEAQIALALNFMPNLTYLNFCLDEKFVEDYNWMFRLLRQSSFTMSQNGPGGPFANIKTIEIGYGGVEYGYNPVFISDFVTLPHLKEIAIKSAWSGETGCGIQWEPEENSSNITTIDLDASSVSNDFIRKLLTACRSPKTFIYSWGSMPEADSMMDLTGFMRALRLRRHTLETIRLDVVLKANVFECFAVEDEYLPPLGSFKDFTRLTELEVPGHLLLGSPLLDWDHFDGEHWPGFLYDFDYNALTDVFPPCLKRLTVDCMGLEEDVTFLLPFLDEFAKHCAERLPNLRFVKLVVVDENDFPLLKDVKEALENQGIEVQVKDFIDEEGWEEDMEVRYSDDGRKKITSRLIGDILYTHPVFQNQVTTQNQVAAQDQVAASN
ncbi:f-box domain cyclin-like protein [Diplodia corticola]|uniref:F-box domain cyclin-like protein n=1 Tax=Diplodia corticola TaxID=236234 RepID=A0A1J9S783_9PEZI|nr:f-box domain cyclin-like protein [Diplodia corticola]OJD36367.1 f-box domain cyclin-like protein [Diplodia corticola]